MRKEVVISLMDLLFVETSAEDDVIITAAKKVPVDENAKFYGDGYTFVDVYYTYASDFAKYLWHLLNERGCFYSTGPSKHMMWYDIENSDKLRALKISVSLDIGLQGLSLGDSMSVFKVPLSKGKLKYNKAELEGGSIATMLVAMIKHFVEETEQEYAWIVTQQEELTKGQEEIIATIDGNTLVLYLQK